MKQPTLSALLSMMSWIAATFSANVHKNEHRGSTIDTDTHSSDTVDIYSHCDPTPNSAIHANNGLYYIKPFADGPIIAAICSNGYTMLDPSLDVNLDRFPSYLSSWDYSRLSLEYIITNLDDTSTFREWWLPADAYTHWRVAAQCKSCEASMDASLANNVAYYTDGTNFCYTVWSDGNPCLAAVNEYTCNKCDVGTFVEDTDTAYTASYWTTCQALQVSSDTPSWHDINLRVNRHLVYRPVMSMTRQACTCYQLHSDLDTPATPAAYKVARTDLPTVTAVKQIGGKQDVRDAVQFIAEYVVFEDERGVMDSSKSAQSVGIDCSHNVHYLTQTDFESGTYRIQECGEYIFTENIVCNFNAPTTEEQSAEQFSPNSIDGDRLYWYPTEEQATTDGAYPGLYSYEGSYSLGFFAGITVECDDVIINLNGFRFEMHRQFYLQQRFFSLIEMAAKPFLPHQGASTWGLTGVYYANNLEIKGPGQIGLSSHHGIKGNNAANVHIHDLSVLHFDVAGIACNGCSYITIENVVVGPQNKEIPTLGRYTHSRAFIPRLKHLNDHYGEEEIQFYGREKTTVAALCRRMVQQMDMIYFNYIDEIEYDPSDEEWIAAQKLFKNPTGWMDGGSSYGIVINGGGAAVVGIGTRITGTEHIQLSNVEVFGIYNQAQEKMKYSLKSGTSRGILFDVMDWIGVTDQIEDRYRSQYVGDVYTDIQFAANKYVQSWYYRNSQYIGPEEEEYVFEGNTAANDYVFLTILPEITEDKPSIGGCGTDIQLHSPKGSIGIMVNGAQESLFEQLYIHDIYNWAELGMDVCGAYPGPSLTTEDIDISYGYTATRSHGMVVDYTTGAYRNIHIENVESWHGEANGLTIYKQSFIELENVMVENIFAGTKLDESEVAALSLPNLVPRACAVDVHDDTEVLYVDDVLRHNNIIGFETCQFNAQQEQQQMYTPVLSGHSPQLIHAVMVIVSSVVCLALLYCVYRLVSCLATRHKRTTDYVGSNEHTPLLDTI
eukprot:CAMPEP_0202695936 /NCGR_PEP_ID=MMETSP1385-20130828/9363_1 /ASSEMBLY_ACC=CAM_ASM_000861 /TAXON_ID=933848 /ORGANISM="Elphidium margaritaceum" /LENGTH=1002 /DNA_ID=CAMNT_0049352021 /DNA_START=118 /DNA_END=3126 /DNA_ORIENTATION=+